MSPSPIFSHRSGNTPMSPDEMNWFAASARHERRLPESVGRHGPSDDFPSRGGGSSSPPRKRGRPHETCCVQSPDRGCGRLGAGDRQVVDHCDEARLDVHRFRGLNRWLPASRCAYVRTCIWRPDRALMSSHVLPRERRKLAARVRQSSQRTPKTMTSSRVRTAHVIAVAAPEDTSPRRRSACHRIRASRDRRKDIDLLGPRASLRHSHTPLTTAKPSFPRKRRIDLAHSALETAGIREHELSAASFL